jgi:hypothetical protein
MAKICFTQFFPNDIQLNRPRKVIQAFRQSLILQKLQMIAHGENRMINSRTVMLPQDRYRRIPIVAADQGEIQSLNA